MIPEHGRMSRVKSFVLFGVCVFQLLTAGALRSESIINGQLGSIKQFKYQVIIDLPRSSCGGGIIHDKFIVTAAHCMYEDHNQSLKVPVNIVAGVDDINSVFSSHTKVIVAVSEYYIPIKYIKNPRKFVADIAVLKLSRSLGVALNPQLASLELPHQDNHAGEQAVVAGFGWDEIETRYNSTTKNIDVIFGDTTGKLRYARTALLRRRDCQKMFSTPARFFSKKLIDIKSSFICAQIIPQTLDHPQGVCKGDSGSPLVSGINTLIGIVSFAYSACDETKKPGVYTKVYHYRTFIKSIMKKDIDPEKTHVVKLPH